MDSENTSPEEELVEDTTVPRPVKFFYTVIVHEDDTVVIERDWPTGISPSYRRIASDNDVMHVSQRIATELSHQAIVGALRQEMQYRAEALNKRLEPTTADLLRLKLQERGVDIRISEPTS